MSITTAKKHFDLSLGGGSYVSEYDRPGRQILLGGRKGHVALLEWKTGKLKSKYTPGLSVILNH